MISVNNFFKKVIDKVTNLGYTIRMKIKAGTKVRHRDNGAWKAIVTSDLSPRHPVNGWVEVEHKGRRFKMLKNLMIESNW